jgi:Ni/Co efflux regulator RcnB
MMKRLLIAALVAVPMCAFAADEAKGDAKKMTPQQERMASCNKDAGAKDLKGDERKKFMSECLSAEKKTYDNKMAACNAKTKGLKKDEANKVRSECMKAPA